MESLSDFLLSGQRHCIGGPWAFGGHAVQEGVYDAGPTESSTLSLRRTEPQQQGR